MKVLFLGGTGIISSACTNLALKQGIEVFHINRGFSHRKISGVKNLTGDIRNFNEMRSLIKNYKFDVVADFISFVPDHIISNIKLFSGLTEQYIFISSASAYQKPVNTLPITEKTPLINPFWKYSRDKALCEQMLMDSYKNEGFPVTIVRPSHTYDCTLIPTSWGYNDLDRMIKGKKIIVHGDGTSTWVLTHNKDFAVGFNGLFAKKEAIGETFHITSDEVINWNYIYSLLASNLGVTADVIHIPSDFIALFDNDVGPGLLGDKTHSVMFDNTKIKSLVPEFNPKIKFEDGVKEITDWYKGNPKWQIIDEKKDKIIESIIEKYERKYS